MFATVNETIPAVLASQNRNSKNEFNPLIMDWQKQQVEFLEMGINDRNLDQYAYAQLAPDTHWASDTCIEV